MKIDNTSLVGVHKFQAAGLGLAPFKFTGMTINLFNNGDGTTKPGGSCDYCGASGRASTLRGLKLRLAEFSSNKNI